MFTKMQGCKKPPKVINVAFLGKYQIFKDLLKDSTQLKRNCVKTFDVKHDAKHYRESQGITGPLKMQFFSIISFLNDSKFYEKSGTNFLNTLYDASE